MDDVAEIKQPKQLTADQIEYRVCEICKSIASVVNGKKRVFLHDDTFSRLKDQLGKSGMYDEVSLLKILKQRIEDNNSQVEGDRKKINNITTRNHNWKDSIFIRRAKIDIREVENAVKENPEKDYYDIYREKFQEKYSL